MPSTLGWLDYDARHQESMKRLLAFFRERESRDELGIGAIRDSIADKLFPGTSTLHTRLRYMLFVPWIYQRLEAQRVDAADVARKARRIEIGLIESLMAEAPEGVIGRIALGSLKTLPSAVYWAALASLGILRFPGSQADYHQAFDRVCQRHASARHREDVDVPAITRRSSPQSLVAGLRLAPENDLIWAASYPKGREPTQSWPVARHSASRRCAGCKTTSRAPTWSSDSRERRVG